MNHGSLFSGIGGFDLAAEWMGWNNSFHCEWNEFGQRVLNYYWPNADSYKDIKTADFSKWIGKIDVLTGGFPCQPYSSAGKRKGKEDERHLWPEMLRAIREISPRWVVGENVRGLVNWNGGMVFDEVQSDLEAEGYEVQPFILPAASVNAPHRRDRVWFVAHSNKCNDGRRTRKDEEESGEERLQERDAVRKSFESGEVQRNAPDSDSQLPQGRSCKNRPEKTKRHSSPPLRGNAWQNFPTESPLHRRDDGLSEKLVKFVVNDLHHEISKTSQENRIENLPEVWERVQQKEVWEKIRGLYSLESKKVLFQTMQLYSRRNTTQVELSPFSQKFSEPILRTLRKHGEFRRSSQGRKLEEQREREHSNSLSFLPHEVALAARRFETELAKFEAWHRNESIKAYGNAVVPQVVYQIFKAIEEYERIGG